MYYIDEDLTDLMGSFQWKAKGINIRYMLLFIIMCFLNAFFFKCKWENVNCTLF